MNQMIDYLCALAFKIYKRNFEVMINILSQIRPDLYKVYIYSPLGVLVGVLHMTEL